MKITKRKAKGVLADMIANMDEDSLAKTREQMSYHNTDIAACEGNGCPMRTTCLRWQLGQTMDDYQWFAIFDPKYCEYYIHNEPTNNNNNGKGN